MPTRAILEAPRGEEEESVSQLINIVSLCPRPSFLLGMRCTGVWSRRYGVL